MTTLAGSCAEFAAAAKAPADVGASVGLRVLDIMGVALAAVPLDTSAAVIDRARDQGGTGEAHAIGVPARIPASAAAFVNGVLAHSLDFDDTHLPSILHPSAPVIPAVLAAAELDGATGAETVDAIAAGLEICVRLGMAGYDSTSRQSLFFERGQHATSICGTIAGAAGAARILGLGVEGIANAIGIAVSMAAGVLEGNRAGGTVKRMHCGIAAQAAVTAADLARRGVTGPPSALEGRFGFFEAFLGGRYDPRPLTEGLGISWEVPRITFKPYPANHFTHTAIDAAIALRGRDLMPDDVAEISLGVAAPVVRTIGEPLEAKRAPETGYQAQFSGPYTVAAALCLGRGLRLEDFSDDAAREPERRALAARVDVVADAECDEIYPMQLPAVLRVRTRDGRELVSKALENRRPSDDELRAKFRDNAARSVGEDASARIEDAALRLDALSSVGDVLEPAAAAE